MHPLPGVDSREVTGMSGRVVHFEIPYDEGDRAQAFYKEAFGWNMMPMPEMSYVIVMTGPTDQETGPTEAGFINGGMAQRSENMNPVPNVVVDVEDIDAALAKVESAGGTKVMGRTAVGEMGWTAYFKDSEGNVLGLWQTA
jgi:predicted enzyme related to lactoylglutathione lyase